MRDCNDTAHRYARYLCVTAVCAVVFCFAFSPEGSLQFARGEESFPQSPFAQPAAGPGLVWSTYLGGSNYDAATAVATDQAGNVLVVGSTQSPDFPTRNADDPDYNGGHDVFVAKFDTRGVLLWSTYYGSVYSEVSTDIATDVAGNVYITGRTNRYPPTTRAQIFLAKLSAQGSLLWATALGGTDDEWFGVIALDAGGNAYVAGKTASGDFPVLNAYDATYNGSGDAFVAKFNSAGVMQWSGYLGGGNEDMAAGIAVDGVGNVYVAGSTSSSDFPTSGAYDGTLGGDSDGFVAKLSAAGELRWSTFLGGSSRDGAGGVVADGRGNVYVRGPSLFLTTFSDTGDLLRTAYMDERWSVSSGIDLDTEGNVHLSGDGAPGFFSDRAALVSTFNPESVHLGTTYLDGSDLDEADDVAADGKGHVFITGQTASTDLPTVGGFDTTPNGDWDAFVAQFAVDRFARSFVREAWRLYR